MGVTLGAAAGWLALLQLEGLGLLALAFALDRCARRRDAATRRAIWTIATATLLIVPLPRLLLDASARALPETAALVVLVVWGLGALVLTLRLALGVSRSRALARRSSPLRRRAWTETLEALQGAGAPVAVELRVTDELSGPVARGVLRPQILVPREMLDVSPEQRRSVLAHELAHVARADSALLLAGALVRALYWITPLSWRALVALRDAAEDAADDAVLGAGVRSSSYAALLVGLARARLDRAGRATAGGLRRRVVAILDPERARSRVSASRWVAPRLAAAAALLACSLTACEARTDPLEERGHASAQGSPALNNINIGSTEPARGK